jgi:hypothetical protein
MSQKQVRGGMRMPRARVAGSVRHPMTLAWPTSGRIPPPVTGKGRP